MDTECIALKASLLNDSLQKANPCNLQESHKLVAACPYGIAKLGDLIKSSITAINRIKILLGDMNFEPVQSLSLMFARSTMNAVSSGKI
jgi:hypothetical protein